MIVQRMFSNRAARQAMKALKEAYVLKNAAGSNMPRKFVSEGFRTVKNPKYNKEVKKAFKELVDKNTPKGSRVDKVIRLNSSDSFRDVNIDGPARDTARWNQLINNKRLKQDFYDQLEYDHGFNEYVGQLSQKHKKAQYMTKHRNVQSLKFD